MKNLKLKGIALILAVLTWSYIFMAEKTSMTKNIPLKLIAPKGEAILSNIPRSIEVTFHGPRGVMANFMKKESGPIVLSSEKWLRIKRKRYTLEIINDFIKRPYTISVKSIRPKKLNITTDREIKKYVPIRADKDFERSQGDIKINPRKALISGPYKVMKKIGLIETHSLSLDDFQQSSKLITELGLPDDRVKILGAHQIEVELFVPQDETKKFEVELPLKFLSRGETITTKVRKVKLTLTAPVGRKKSRIKEELEAIIIVPRVKRAGTFFLTPQVNAPSEIQILKMRPKTIKVRARR